MSNLKAVLFDLDGTLINHFRTIHHCLSLAARACGLREPSLEEVHAAVGGGILATRIKLFGVEGAERLGRIYPAIWEQHLLHDVEVLPGVAEALEALHGRGIELAVMTNKDGPSSRRICSHLGWDRYLRQVAGVGDTPWRKPESGFSRHMLEVLGVRADEAVLVGDSPYDAGAAQVVGMRFVGVSTGTHTAAELREAGACAVFGRMDAVAEFLGAGEAHAAVR